MLQARPGGAVHAAELGERVRGEPLRLTQLVPLDLHLDAERLTPIAQSSVPGQQDALERAGVVEVECVLETEFRRSQAPGRALPGRFCRYLLDAAVQDALDQARLPFVLTLQEHYVQNFRRCNLGKQGKSPDEAEVDEDVGVGEQDQAGAPSTTSTGSSHLESSSRTSMSGRCKISAAREVVSFSW